MNKKAEGSGIGIVGVFLAILIFFLVRGCVSAEFQDQHNEFCNDNGFDYGTEVLKNTLIVCYNFDDNLTQKFKYSDFEIWKKEWRKTQ